MRQPRQYSNTVFVTNIASEFDYVQEIRNALISWLLTNRIKYYRILKSSYAYAIEFRCESDHLAFKLKYTNVDLVRLVVPNFNDNSEYNSHYYAEGEWWS